MWIPSYKKPSSGGGYEVPLWSTGTDEEIVTALEKHYAGEIDLTQFWSVGDERVVSLSAMDGTYSSGTTQVAQDVVFVLTEVGGKTLSDGVTECCFQVDQKDCLKEPGAMYWGNAVPSYRLWCNNTYYNAIPETLRPIFKQFTYAMSYNGNLTTYTGYFTFRAESEITGAETYSLVAGQGEQVEYYKTATNRIKVYHQSNKDATVTYWTRSGRGRTSNNQWIAIKTDGTAYYYSATGNYYFAPFGVI